jgi:phosphoserine phosphatase
MPTPTPTPNNVLVLIAPPGSAGLDRHRAERLARELDRAEPLRWLAPSEAAEVPFFGDPAAVRSRIGGTPGITGLDWAILPIEGRRKKLLVADMDSTIVTGETLDELAAYAGVGLRVAAITVRSMRGELDFAAALRERVALLEGLDADTAIAATAAGIVVTSGASVLVRTMRKHGALTALVSGGFTAFTGLVRDRVGFDLDRANTLEITDGKLTGRVVEPILGRETKLELLRSLAAERGIDIAETLAVGDGANDLAMIQAAGMGVAFRAKPIVTDAAKVKVEHGDLTALLYFQGYTSAEFVTD